MCHRSDYQGRGPNLVGLFGKPVLLDDGRTVIADESYIRESIIFPGVKIVSGFKNIMPNFQGQIGEEEVISLVEYIKSLGSGQHPPPSMTEPTGVYPVSPQPETSMATPSGK
jgi:cytochrome c oxidase subunit 2